MGGEISQEEIKYWKSGIIDQINILKKEGFKSPSFNILLTRFKVLIQIEEFYSLDIELIKCVISEMGPLELSEAKLFIENYQKYAPSKTTVEDVKKVLFPLTVKTHILGKIGTYNTRVIFDRRIFKKLIPKPVKFGGATIGESIIEWLMKRREIILLRTHRI